MCYAIPLLKTEEEFWTLDDDEKSVNEVTELPPNFREWIEDNKDRIKAAEERGKLPYFIRDNRNEVDNMLNPERVENLKYFSPKDFKSIQDGNFFGASSIIKLNEILVDQGFSKEEINKLSHLIDLHRHGGENQADTDIEIAIIFREKDSRIGQMLRVQAEVEEEAYRIYRYKNPPIQITRAGRIDRDTFSFTMNKDGVIKTIEGVDIHWGTDIRTTLDEILKENRLVAGLLRSDIGYADERELFFISKTHKQLTPQFIKEWKKNKEQKQIEAERVERLKEFNQKKNETAGKLMSMMGSGVPMNKIFELQNEFMNVSDGDMKSLNRINTLINASNRHAARSASDIQEIQSRWNNNKTSKSAPHYGSVMKLGRSAAKEAMKIVDEIGAPILSEAQKKNIRELADALGISRKNIKPMSFLDADQGASNPTRDDENCQSVVVAFEARRRGLDCYALPYSPDPDSANYALGERFQDAWINPKTNKTIEPTILKGGTDAEILAKFKKGCSSDGRYILGINYKNGDGHVVSIERTGGKLIIKDEQTDDYYELSSIQDITYLELIRIDKAILNVNKIKSVLGI